MTYMFQGPKNRWGGVLQLEWVLQLGEYGTTHMSLDATNRIPWNLFRWVKFSTIFVVLQLQKRIV